MPSRRLVPTLVNKIAAGEVVLDPFMGSGQTAIAAIKSRRHWVGYEINPDYVALAEKRIREFASGFCAPALF